MQSMTGFGRAEHSTNLFSASVELTSVNRKQLDLNFNLPRDLAELEIPFRKFLQERISRGRINVSVQLKAMASSSEVVHLDPERARALDTAFVELSQVLQRPIQLQAGDFLRAPGLFDFQTAARDPKDCRDAIQPALAQALTALLDSRLREGSDLRQDTEERLGILEKLMNAIGEKAPEVTIRHRENLHLRLNDAGLELNLDDERILKEIGLFAERCDISEELTRLSSHFSKFRETLGSTEPSGRSLDFLCQEINREFNTIGSKANDAGIAQNVVLAKTELEKIREQIQNVE